MKNDFVAEDYDNFVHYTYSKVIEIIGEKENIVKPTEQGMNNMKNDGFLFIDLI